MNLSRGINKVVGSQAFGWLCIGAGLFIAWKVYKKGKVVVDNTITELVHSGATLNRKQITNIANQIKAAWGIFNDDEEAVYAAFRQLNNQEDLNYLEEVYSYKTSVFGSETLRQSLTSRMNAKERAKINEILKQKGIIGNF